MSHTATGEWKSFEIRMRRRRAERLVLRADVAIEAECLDDARALLDEARKLWAGAPGIAEVESRLRAAETPKIPAPVPLEKTGRPVTAAVAAGVLFFTIAAAAAALHGRPGATSPSAPVLAHRDVQVTIQPVTAAEPNPAPVAVPAALPQPASESVSVSQDEVAVPNSALDARNNVAPEPKSPAPLPAATIGRTRIPEAAVQTTLSRIAAVPSITPPAEPAGEPVRLASATSPASAPATTAAVDAAMVVDSAAIEPPQDAVIRGTLDSYADAYSQLDADAAQRVWPMVNRDALSRAFESLESQRVSLGDCRIQVDGTSARARCAGTATWTPKVGGGERTDERDWTFELSKAAGRWQIVSARVQNR